MRGKGLVQRHVALPEDVANSEGKGLLVSLSLLPLFRSALLIIPNNLHIFLFMLLATSTLQTCNSLTWHLVSQKQVWASFSSGQGFEKTRLFGHFKDGK